MDNRDEIIRTQLDVISTLINNNLRNIGNDLWGDEPPGAKPAEPSKPEAKQTKKAAPQQKAAQQPAEATEEELPPPEKIEDLKAELNELIGLDSIKKEVNNLINMVTIHKLRQMNNLKTVDMSLHMVFTPATPARARP